MQLKQLSFKMQHFKNAHLANSEYFTQDNSSTNSFVMLTYIPYPHPPILYIFSTNSLRC
uniref:Uncharacterized protein n=1 Tax=Anguilla anguilla TaxID=7936 RepID=A0A0E9W7S7_ANGAN